MQAKTFTQLEKRLRHQTGEAISDYHLIEEGDRIMVCLSGGKDSYTMLDMLQALQRAAPIKFDLVAVNLDQKQPGFPELLVRVDPNMINRQTLLPCLNDRLERVGKLGNDVNS